MMIASSSNWRRFRAEEALAATRAVTIDAEDASIEHVGSEAIDAEYEQAVYFYGRHDSTQKLYRLPLYQADTWMVCRTQKIFLCITESSTDTRTPGIASLSPTTSLANRPVQDLGSRR